MPSINSFEEILAWKKARELCKVVYEMTAKENFAKEFSLKDQIKRSSGSVMDNIAEGFDRGTTKEFRRFLFIAKGSLSEVKSQLFRALDQKYIDKSEFEEGFKTASEAGKLIGGLLNYLEKEIKSGRLREPTVKYHKLELKTDDLNISNPKNKVT